MHGTRSGLVLLDCGDGDLEVRLAMPVLLEITALLLVLEDGDGLVAADLSDNTLDGCSCDGRGADHGIRAVARQKDLREVDDIPFLMLALHLLDGDGVTDGDKILLTAGHDDSKRSILILLHRGLRSLGCRLLCRSCGCLLFFGRSHDDGHYTA